MKTFSLRVIASDRTFFEGRAEILVVNCMDGGEKAILAHHENMVIAVNIGNLRFRTAEGITVEATVGQGFAQIINNRVTVLVDTAERPEEIDAKRAQEALERAEEQLRQKQSLQEYYMTQAAMARAMTRLKITSKYNNS